MFAAHHRHELPSGLALVLGFYATMIVWVMGVNHFALVAPGWCAYACLALFVLLPLHTYQRLLVLDRRWRATRWSDQCAAVLPALTVAAVPAWFFSEVARATPLVAPLDSFATTMALLLFELLCLLAAIRRHVPLVTAEPAAALPRLAEGAQRSALTEVAGRFGVDLADVRVEVGNPRPEMWLTGERRPLLAVSQACCEGASAAAREGMLALALARRRWRRPLATLLYLLPLLGLFVWLHQMVVLSTWVCVLVVAAVHVCAQPLWNALLLRLADRSAERRAAAASLLSALEITPARGLLSGGLISNLWHGSAPDRRRRRRWRRLSGEAPEALPVVGPLPAARAWPAPGRSGLALVERLLPWAAAAAAVTIPAMLLLLPARAPSASQVPYVAGALVALMPFGYALLQQRWGRTGLDPLRVLIAGLPAWAAYLAVLHTAVTWDVAAPPGDLTWLAFLAGAALACALLVPVVRHLLTRASEG